MTIIILPGLDGTGELVRRFAAALPEALNSTVISYPADVALSYCDLERYVTERLPGNGRFVLLGESFSGPLALRIGARGHPRLSAIVLVATFVRNPVWWFHRSLRGLVGDWLFRLPPSDWQLRRHLAGPDAPSELLATLRAVRSQVAPSVLAARVREVLAVDAVDDLRRCTVPLLYLGGSRDRLVPPSTARRLKAIRPDLEVAILDAPHLVLQRQPDEAARIVSVFV